MRVCIIADLPNPRDSPIREDPEPMAGCIPVLLEYPLIQQPRHRSGERTHQTPPPSRPWIPQPRQLPPTHAPNRQRAKRSHFKSEEPLWGGGFFREPGTASFGQIRTLLLVVSRGEGKPASSNIHRAVSCKTSVAVVTGDRWHRPVAPSRMRGHVPHARVSPSAHYSLRGRRGSRSRMQVLPCPPRQIKPTDPES